MTTSLQSIADKARRVKKHRFQNLCGLLTEEFLIDTYKYLNKNSATGLDKISVREYGRNLKGNVKELVKRLKEKRYRAPMIKRVFIPKANGKTRPLGLPVTEDKLLQLAVKRILSPIFEVDFLACSYGYRPGLGGRDAVKAITRELNFGRYTYVVEADIKGFFDNIDHEWLIKMLKLRIDDRVILRLVEKWLRAGVLDADGNVSYPTSGTPQGGIISPLLANIYLHYALDLWFEKVVKKYCEGEAYICRYADDFVCAFRFSRDAEKFYSALEKRLDKFSLNLAEEKTRIIKFNRHKKKGGNRFCFLGFEFFWDIDRSGKDCLKRRTDPKKQIISLKNFKVWCRESRNFRLKKLFDLLNSKLRGYYNYYGLIGNYDSMSKFFYYAIRILYKWLNRRSQRRSFNWSQFKDVLDYFKVERPRITEPRFEHGLFV
jgi:group II intron reverse transcriptase/maturase